jgi:hypothetical protein
MKFRSIMNGLLTAVIILLWVLFALLATGMLALAASVNGPTAPDGTEVQNDLPAELHVRNRGGSDGAGLCVFASLKHSAIFQEVTPLKEIFEYMFSRPGGGYPDKVDRVIRDICKQKGVPIPPYIQVEGKDIEILKLACKTGRAPGVTYGFSPSGRYGGQRIAHMVTLLHADNKWFCVLDNNFPKTYEWMTPQEFQRAYTADGGWCVIFLDSGPPPVPEN